MAVFRPPEYCPFCGEEINAIYMDQSDVPFIFRLIGDTFIRYDYENHKCDPIKKTERMKQLKWPDGIDPLSDMFK